MGRIVRKGKKGRKDSLDTEIKPEDDDFTKCRKLVKKEHKRWMDEEDKSPEEAKLSKK